MVKSEFHLLKWKYNKKKKKEKERENLKRSNS